MMELLVEEYGGHRALIDKAIAICRDFDCVYLQANRITKKFHTEKMQPTEAQCT